MYPPVTTGTLGIFAILLIMLFAFIEVGVMRAAYQRLGLPPRMVTVLLFGMIYFTWGEIYSLFPATCTDAFGAKYAATNAGLLYTAKGMAAIFGGPLAAWLVSLTGGWESVFLVAAVMDLAAAVMALFVLKPMRAAHQASVSAVHAAVQAAR